LCHFARQKKLLAGAMEALEARAQEANAERSNLQGVVLSESERDIPIIKN
jgi:hypothetical protein